MIRTPKDLARTIIFDNGFINASTGAAIVAPDFTTVTVVIKINPADTTVAPSTKVNALANTLTSNAITIDTDSKHPKITLTAANVDTLGHAQIIMLLDGAVELVQQVDIVPQSVYDALERGISLPASSWV